MHIGFVAPIRYGDQYGGRTRATRIQELLSESHRVTQINVNPGDATGLPDYVSGEDIAVTDDRLPPTVRQVLTTARAVRRAKHYDFDLIYSYNSWLHTPIAGHLCARRLGVPHLVGVNDHREASGLVGTVLNGHLRRYVLERAAVLVLESETLERNLIEQRISARTTVTVPTGIDIEEFYRPDVPPADRPTVFYVGRDEDINLLLDAVERVRQRVPDVVVRVAGVDAADHDHPAIDRDEVHLMGFVEQERLYQELARAHVCVVPYREANTAGRPVKILEYMSARKCIVATDLPFNTQMLTDGTNAILTAPETEPFADGIVRALTDPDLRERLAARAREDVTAYSLERMRENLETAVEIATNGRDAATDAGIAAE